MTEIPVGSAPLPHRPRNHQRPHPRRLLAPRPARITGATVARNPGRIRNVGPRAEARAAGAKWALGGEKCAEPNLAEVVRRCSCRRGADALAPHPALPGICAGLSSDRLRPLLICRLGQCPREVAGWNEFPLQFRCAFPCNSAAVPLLDRVAEFARRSE
jgi:hypothetical protein